MDRVASRRAAALAACALVLVVAVGSAAASEPGRVLVVEDAATGERLLATPVTEGEHVTLAYHHSVEKTPVRDVYAVDGTDLVTVRMEFDSYGWGLPARADVELANGTLVTYPDGRFDRLPVKPGHYAGHVLVVGDRSYDLVALSDERAVVLRVERRTPADRVAAAVRDALAAVGVGTARADPASTGVLRGGAPATTLTSPTAP